MKASVWKRSINIRQNRYTWAWTLAGFVLLCFISIYFIIDKPASAPYVRKSGYTMGAQTISTVYGSTYQAAEEAAESIQQSIHSLDSAINWRLAGSQTAEANQNAGTGWTNAPEVVPIVKELVQISEDTNGQFDLTIAPVTQLWDIDGENPKVPAKKEIQKLLELVDYRNVRIKDDSIQLEEGQQLDLGAVGKGLACDYAYEVFQSANALGAVVSVGGSVGVYGQKPDESPWHIEIQDPFDRDAIIGTLYINGTGFISTSGDYEKYFIQDNQKYHHLLDATTGFPAQNGLVSVTVLTDSGLYSDALSTACFIAGREKSLALLKKYRAEGIFVDNQRHIYCTEGIAETFKIESSAEYTIHELH